MADEVLTYPGNGSALRVQVANLEKVADDHEERLRLLERAHWRAAGLAACATALAAAGANILMAALK